MLRGSGQRSGRNPRRAHYQGSRQGSDVARRQGKERTMKHPLFSSCDLDTSCLGCGGGRNPIAKVCRMCRLQGRSISPPCSRSQLSTLA